MQCVEKKRSWFLVIVFFLFLLLSGSWSSWNLLWWCSYSNNICYCICFPQRGLYWCLHSFPVKKKDLWNKCHSPIHRMMSYLQRFEEESPLPNGILACAVTMKLVQSRECGFHVLKRLVFSPSIMNTTDIHTRRVVYFWVNKSKYIKHRKGNIISRWEEIFERMAGTRNCKSAFHSKAVKVHLILIKKAWMQKTKSKFKLALGIGIKEWHGLGVESKEESH